MKRKRYKAEHHFAKVEGMRKEGAHAEVKKTADVWTKRKNNNPKELWVRSNSKPSN